LRVRYECTVCWKVILADAQLADLAPVSAGEAAMAGDTPETDVQGARQAGLILFVRTGTAGCSRVLTAPAIGFVIICS